MCPALLSCENNVCHINCLIYTEDWRAEQQAPGGSVQAARMNQVYEIFLLGFQDKRFVIDVATSEDGFQNTTVKKLKKLVADKLNNAEKVGSINPEDIKLVFADKSLEDDKTLNYYKILPKSTVIMIYGLEGGWC